MRKLDDSWKEIQKKTFTNWFNDRLRGHLKVAKRKIEDLRSDLKDGLLLIDLAEKIAKKPIGRYNKAPSLKPHYIENLGLVLRFFAAEKIKLVNIGKRIQCLCVIVCQTSCVCIYIKDRCSDLYQSSELAPPLPARLEMEVVEML